SADFRSLKDFGSLLRCEHHGHHPPRVGPHAERPCRTPIAPHLRSNALSATPARIGHAVGGRRSHPPRSDRFRSLGRDRPTWPSLLHLQRRFVFCRSQISTRSAIELFQVVPKHGTIGRGGSSIREL